MTSAAVHQRLPRPHHPAADDVRGPPLQEVLLHHLRRPVRDPEQGHPDQHEPEPRRERDAEPGERHERAEAHDPSSLLILPHPPPEPWRRRSSRRPTHAVMRPYPNDPRRTPPPAPGRRRASWPSRSGTRTTTAAISRRTRSRQMNRNPASIPRCAASLLLGALRVREVRVHAPHEQRPTRAYDTAFARNTQRRADRRHEQPADQRPEREPGVPADRQQAVRPREVLLAGDVRDRGRPTRGRTAPRTRDDDERDGEQDRRASSRSAIASQHDRRAALADDHHPPAVEPVPDRAGDRARRSRSMPHVSSIAAVIQAVDRVALEDRERERGARGEGAGRRRSGAPGPAGGRRPFGPSRRPAGAPWS